ncbi:MAG: hypothetical protein O3A46_03900 [Candidatus Poribacteria bacterium]|nr:hypothetical protein [Candidatus Poribacteria bacterium]
MPDQVPFTQFVGAHEDEDRENVTFLLSPDHPANLGKWAAWSAIGYTLDDVELVLERLYESIHAATVVRVVDTKWGLQYRTRVEFPVRSPTFDARAVPVDVSWEIAPADPAPRLLNAIVKLPKRRNHNAR